MEKLTGLDITGVDAYTFPEPISFDGTEENILNAANKFCRGVELENNSATVHFTAFYRDAVYNGEVIITAENNKIHPRLFQWLIMRDIFSQIGIISGEVNAQIKQFAENHTFGYEKRHYGFLVSDMRRLNFIEPVV